jgi:hypothetical protein
VIGELPPIGSRVVAGGVDRKAPGDDIHRLVDEMTQTWDLSSEEANTIRVVAMELLAQVLRQGRVPVTFQGEIFRRGFRFEFVTTTGPADATADVRSRLLAAVCSAQGVQQHPRTDTVWLELDRTVRWPVA